jgi:hypothetical protein
VSKTYIAVVGLLIIKLAAAASSSSDGRLGAGAGGILLFLLCKGSVLVPQ